MLFICIVLSLLAGFWLGHHLGTTLEREHWVNQIKQDERLRHLTQGNAFWQK